MPAREMCIAAGAAAIGCSLLHEAHAGAWQRGTFERLDIQTVEAYRSESPGNSFSQLTIRNYGEMGLPGPFSVGGQLAHVDQESLYDGGATYASGVGEAELFGIYHWDGHGPSVSGLKLRGRFATAKFAGPQRVMGQDAAIGAGTVHGFDLGRAFAAIDAGYLRSLGGDADQIVVDATLGLRAGAVTVLVQSFLTESVLPKTDDGLDYDLHQLSLSAVIPLRKNLRLEAGGRADIEARGFSEGASMFASLWWFL